MAPRPEALTGIECTRRGGTARRGDGAPHPGRIGGNRSDPRFVMHTPGATAPGVCDRWTEACGA